MAITLKVNIDYELCNSSIITSYIKECNIGNYESGENDENDEIKLYINNSNLKQFHNILQKCVKKGSCKIIDSDTSDYIKKNDGTENSFIQYTIKIENQFWYKEIIEKGKAFHINNTLSLWTFYSFKKN